MMNARMKEDHAMAKRTWMVVDDGPDTRIMECRRTDNNQDELVTYEEAKAQAVQILEDHVAPALNRIEELKQDEFQKRGQLPSFKVWESKDLLVAARTKKRAMELTNESRYGFNLSFKQVTDSSTDWWYPYAQEESIWEVLRNDRGWTTGEYRKILGQDEAMAIIHEELAKYETLPIAQLVGMIGNEEMIERVCTEGLPVQVVIEVCQYGWEPSVIRVEAEIKERVLRWCRAELRRDIPKQVCNWKAEGF